MEVGNITIIVFWGYVLILRERFRWKNLWETSCTILFGKFVTLTISAAIAYCKNRQLDYQSQKLIVAHLGGGISVSLHLDGKIIDIINDEDGCFAPERAGDIPQSQLVDLCFSIGNKNDVMRMGFTPAKRILPPGSKYVHLLSGQVSCFLRIPQKGIIIENGHLGAWRAPPEGH